MGTETALVVADERRLVISEMVLENFKSYAGVQRVGPFHKASCLVAASSSGPPPGSQSLTSACCRASRLWWAPTAVASPTS